MKLMSFAEIQDLENGQQVSSFQGTIKKVFDQKTDHGQYGQWWLQNIILQDDHANELTVTWACEDPWSPKDEGKQLLFESGFDKKDQIVGLKREIKKKGTKVYESVKVDDRAKVKTIEGGSSMEQKFRSKPEMHDADPYGQHGEVSGPPGDPDWPEAPPDAPESSQMSSVQAGGVLEAREHLMRSANLYCLCVACVEKVIAPSLPVVAQTSEQFQAAVGTLFIEASRAGYVSKMPSKPL